MMLEDYGVDWRVGYLLFWLAMVILGVGLWSVIRGWIDRRMSNGVRRREQTG